MKRSHFWFALRKPAPRSSFCSVSRNRRVHPSAHPHHHVIPIKLRQAVASRFGIVGGGRDDELLAGENLDIDGILDLAVEGGALTRRIAPAPGVLPSLARDGATKNA